MVLRALWQGIFCQHPEQRGQLPLLAVVEQVLELRALGVHWQVEPEEAAGSFVDALGHGSAVVEVAGIADLQNTE